GQTHDMRFRFFNPVVEQKIIKLAGMTPRKSHDPRRVLLHRLQVDARLPLATLLAGKIYKMHQVPVPRLRLREKYHPERFLLLAIPRPIRDAQVTSDDGPNPVFPASLTERRNTR